MLLEAMACGCPVLGARVGGVPEVVADERVGRVADRSADAFARALKECLGEEWDRAAIRKYAEGRSWESTARMCVEVLSAAADPTTGSVRIS